MEPLIHTYKHRCTCGAATLETTIDYTYIDGVIEILNIENVLNDSYPIPVDESSYMEYRMRFTQALKGFASRDLERMKDEALMHNKWLREELQIIGATS